MPRLPRYKGGTHNHGIAEHLKYFATQLGGTLSGDYGQPISLREKENNGPSRSWAHLVGRAPTPSLALVLLLTVKKHRSGRLRRFGFSGPTGKAKMDSQSLVINSLNLLLLENKFNVFERFHQI